MSLEAVLDYIAQKARIEVDGLKRVYSPGADDNTTWTLPPTIDDSPVGEVLPAGSSATAGNFEMELHDILLRLYFSMPPGSEGAAYKRMVPFPGRVKRAFRTNVGGDSTDTEIARILYQGYDPPEAVEVHGKWQLQLDFHFEVLDLQPSDEYSD